MIVFEHVSKRYGQSVAIDDLSFTINPGEFVFFVGPSGAGKTTIGRLMIQQLPITSGEIQIGDFKLSSLKAKEIPILRQQIGVVFQDYRLLPDRTASENIALALEIAGKSEETVTKTVTELLRVVGLEGKDHLFPHQLSGGECQRVVIARALATDPAVLFADEPTGNLDKENAYKIVDLLNRINQHGTTVIMATHDEDLVNRLKKRIIRINQGKLVSDISHAQTNRS